MSHRSIMRNLPGTHCSDRGFVYQCAWVIILRLHCTEKTCLPIGQSGGANWIMIRILLLCGITVSRSALDSEYKACPYTIATLRLAIPMDCICYSTALAPMVYYVQHAFMYFSPKKDVCSDVFEFRLGKRKACIRKQRFHTHKTFLNLWPELCLFCLWLPAGFMSSFQSLNPEMIIHLCTKLSTALFIWLFWPNYSFFTRQYSEISRNVFFLIKLRMNPTVERLGC